MEKSEILRRYVTSHSFRHMANSLLGGSVDEYLLRLTIGHSSKQLSYIYTHLTEGAIQSIQMTQKGNILPLIGLE